MEATQSTQFTGKMEWGKYVGKPIATKLLTLLNECLTALVKKTPERKLELT